MRSEFRHGVLGFLIVFSTIVGGMSAAGICHEMLTPNIDIFYMIWLWVGGIPFWWLAVRTLVARRFEHPVATYLAILPLVLLFSLLLSWIGPGNLWLIALVSSIAYFVYIIVGERVGRLFRRRPNPPSD